jgi:nucleoside-diphosphate-sugar epimerase
MASERYPLHHRGIYKNLPTFDPSIKGLTAIVTGANGISGFHTMRVLLESPERWSKVYALSRRPPPEKMMQLLTPDERSRVQHVSCDFLSEPEDIAKALKSTTADLTTVSHVFFYSYLQPKPEPGAAAWSNAEQLVKYNTSLLSNFLAALQLTNIQPRRVILQTGAKNYGIHIGRTRTPCVESDPQPKHLEPNFYYPQEKVLFAYCKENKASWNVIRPAWIIGAVENAQMNAFHPFAVYAAVQSYKKEPLSFPGDWPCWQYESHHSTAKMTGYLTEWVSLEEKCKDQAFNAQDGSPLTWDRFYEELARWYAVERGVVGPEEDESKFKELIRGRNSTETPMG